MESLSETDRTIQANLGSDLDPMSGIINASLLEDLINGPGLESLDSVDCSGGYPQQPLNGSASVMEPPHHQHLTSPQCAGGLKQLSPPHHPHHRPAPAHQPPHLPYPHPGAQPGPHSQHPGAQPGPHSQHPGAQPGPHSQHPHHTVAQQQHIHHLGQQAHPGQNNPQHPGQNNQHPGQNSQQHPGQNNPQQHPGQNNPQHPGQNSQHPGQNPHLAGVTQPHKNNQFCPQLPDSPPDSSASGSEPYSPPNADHSDPTQQHPYNVKTMTSMPQQQQLYMSHSTHAQPQAPPSHSSSTPPHTQSSPCAQVTSQMPPQIHPQQLAGFPHSQPRQPTYSYGMEPPKLTHPAVPPGIALNPNMLPSVTQYSPMNNLANHCSKKRKHESPNGTVTAAVLNGMAPVMAPASMLNIKAEPGTCLINDCDDDGYGGMDYFGPEMGNSFMEGAYQVIKWQPFSPKQWGTLLDHNYKELPSPSYRVDADKGFNFSISDDAFVCQKKNHFQVTSHMELHGRPKFVKTQEGKVQPIDHYYLHFYGVKLESHSQLIKVEQSQSDRSKKAFHPVRVDLANEQMCKVTVGRLHFSETTTNNMRKKGKPNPDQRYFMLVVSLRAHHGDDPEGAPIVASCSERIIVRASNPGQFDQEVDANWQKGHTNDVVYHIGKVGINTDRPEENLVVHGNARITGHVIQPSDKRVKTDIKELDPRQQLENITKLKVYEYSYDNEYSEYVGKAEDDRKDTGVLAQELREVLPDAVKETGDVELSTGMINGVLGVNKDRIYMENVGAVKELCKVTDKLETRIIELEYMNKKLTKAKVVRTSSVRSNGSTMSMSTCSTISGFTKDKDTKERENQEKQDKPEKKKSHRPAHSARGHHRSHSRGRDSSSNSSQGEESILCSNRFIQISIVVLVFVMAFCLLMGLVFYILEQQSTEPPRPNVVAFLVSITVLYILEKDESGSQTPQIQATPSVFNPMISITTIFVMEQNSDSGWGKIPEFNLNRTDDTDDGGTGNETSFPDWVATTEISFPPDGHGVPITPDGIVPPLGRARCLERPDECHVYCCYSNHVPTLPPHTTIIPDDPENKGHGQGNETVTIGPDTKPHPGIEVHVHQDPKADSKEANETPKSDEDGPGAYVPQVYDYDDTMRPYAIIDDGERRKRRHADAGSDFMHKAEIVLIDVNRTLGSEYCTNDHCVTGYGGNFTYQVPLAPTFPTDYVTIEFRMDDSLSVFKCDDRMINECSQHSDVRAGRHETHSWSLPIGYYADSYFWFRVAPAHLDNVCEIDASRLYQDFSYYWLEFHRVRSPTCTSNDLVQGSD